MRTTVVFVVTNFDVVFHHAAVANTLSYSIRVKIYVKINYSFPFTRRFKDVLPLLDKIYAYRIN